MRFPWCKPKVEDPIPVVITQVIEDLPPGILDLPANPCKEINHSWSIWSNPYKHWKGSTYTWQARRCLACNKVEERMS